ncbi:MAG TPA: hypothetical protein VLG76_06205 [Rhabdochlamydiaceae bacterium]|nr:hypothetical protein [Rhabdochlamydiaceae bacterium]
MKFKSLLFFCIACSLSAQTIEEKKGSSLTKENSDSVQMDHLLQDVNERLGNLKLELQNCCEQASNLLHKQAKNSEYEGLLSRVGAIKAEMAKLQERWRESVVSEAKREEEGYALWEQEEITLSQLIMEYGGGDYLYIVPPELGSVKLSMHSTIPIPRESWTEVLEIILAHNGIGVKKINPYAKQLVVFKQDPASVQRIASSPKDLVCVQNNERIFYVFSPPPEQAKVAFQFFERFSDPKQTFIYQIGGKIAIISLKEEIEKLLSLYNTVWEDPKGKISKVVPIAKMSAKEMEKILHAFFGDAIERSAIGRPPFAKTDPEGLSILLPGQGNALVLLGNREIVERAEKIVKETEEQLQDPAEMTVFLYTCKHSDPVDLAKILDRVYFSLIVAGSDIRENTETTFNARGASINPPDGYASSPPLVVPPQTFKPEVSTKLEETSKVSDHFIPDPKTGNLLMVIRRDTLARIKELLRRIDVPKKMVQIEVLLFEKKLNNHTSFGLNLLKIGSSKNGVRFDGGPPVFGPHKLADRVREGVTAFLFSHNKTDHFPAFDIAYSFLLTQEDIQLNAAPSVITVNQTPATISILEEISINNGAAPIDTNKGIAFEKSFTRSQFGITIILTPIVHLPDDENIQEEKGFVTLQTNITFDTTKPHPDERPLVDKRHIENEVRVVDGETVILGGLRRKASQDSQEKVPFLGEIPGLGKLFGTTALTDMNTEMFFFITPKIILDPKDQLVQVRREQLRKRPGDVPEFMRCYMEAREKEKKRYFAQSLKVLFGS